MALSAETIKNMNNTTAKHATWILRILDPKLIKYKFSARGQVVNAEKFQCVLVSQNPKEYMIGNVPFAFQDRNAAKKAFQIYTTNLTFEA